MRYKGDLVVGGLFQSIGGIAVRNLARWDGVSWHPLGDGLDGTITSLAVFEGALYAAGDFQYVNGVFSPNLAKWDGSAWAPFGILQHSYLCCYQLNSLVVYRGELLAGGSFSPRETGVYGIARWDGAFWVPFHGGVNGTVQRMTATGDSLYVAGQFDSAGGVPASNIALWDGAAWSALGGGVGAPGVFGGVLGLACYQGKVYVGGSFDSVGGAPIHKLAAWDGASWASLDDRVTEFVSALAVDGGLLAIASFPGVLHWDGSSIIGDMPGLYGFSAQILPDDAGLTVIGDLTIGTSDPSTTTGFQIARWDGGAWRSFEPWDSHMKGLAMFAGYPAGVRCLEPYQGSLVAGGLIDYVADGAKWRAVGGLVRWDGSSWSPLRAFSPYGWGAPNSIYTEGETLYVGGEYWEYTGPSTGFLRRPAQRWDTNEWTPLDTLSLTGTCFLRYGGALLVGTTRGRSDDSPLAGIYELRGGSWHPFALTAGASQFHGVSRMTLHQGRLVVAGSFNSIGGVAAPNGVAEWNGSAWESLGNPIPNPYLPPYVDGLVSAGGELYVAGEFWTPTGLRPVLIWDGSTWRPADGLYGSANGMAMIRGRIFVGGRMHMGSNPDLVTVVTLDGNTWTPLGSGVNGWPGAFAEFQDALYVGGTFSFAGGKSSFSIARWRGLGPIIGSREPWLSAGRPNPFRATSDFSYRLEAGDAVRISVHDVRGREVAVLEEGFVTAGTHPVRWDGRDRAGRAAPAGIYFVSVRTGSGVLASRKIVRLR